MIIVVHGTDTTKSYNLILNQQQKYGIKNITYVDIDKISPMDLYEKVASSSLFGDKPFVVLNVTNAIKETVQDFINILNKAPADSVLIIYATKTLPKTNEFLKYAESNRIKVICLEKTINSNTFRFIELAFSQNRTQSYKELKTLLDENNDEFYIFSMLMYQLRALAKVKFNAPSIKKMKDYQISKLNLLLQKYSTNSLQSIYKYFYNLDKKVKLGEITPELMITMALEKVLNS